MKRLATLALGLSLLAPGTGCATILGTAVSPITGGVNLAVQTLDDDEWPLWLPVFLGGAIAGPFVAFYNGVNHDASIFQSYRRYWVDFDEQFRPFEKIGVGGR